MPSFYKEKKFKSIDFKDDLFKAYDHVDRNFLRIILLQTGLSGLVVDWIMACVSSTNFFVLVNGSPSPFFTTSRGLRQGFPLSPLLFLLVIEGLSRLINSRKDDERIKGIDITITKAITHLFFVDDVLVFGSVKEWKEYSLLFQVFTQA